MSEDKKTTQEILQGVIDLGAEGHEILIEALHDSWAQATKDLLDEATPPGDLDVEKVLTDMLQISIAMSVTAELSGTLLAIRKYNLTEKVLGDLDGAECDHPECKVLRKARANPDNN